MTFLKTRVNGWVWPKAISVIRPLTFALGFLLTCLPVFSQGNAGRIVGTITDQSGGAMVGASVTITDVQRGISRNLTTDDAGVYAAPNLLPGTYTIRAEAKGFKTIERQSILLEVGGDIRVDLSLQPGEQIETVTVTQEIPLMDATNATVGGTFSNQAINDLPLNGRNYQNLLTLRPGVIIYPGGGGWSQSANDIRPEDNTFIVDGLSDDEPFSALTVINAPGLVGDAVTVIPIDAIQEFTSVQNPKAEYGWKPGVVVNVGLKSGTNNIHGTAYAFGRSDAFDALNYFVPVTQPLEFEQFGATAGGPLVKDKLFWFLGYEGQRYTITTTLPSFVPSSVPGAGPGISIPDAKADLAANGVGANLLSQLSLNLLNLFPANAGLSSSVSLPFPSTNSSDSSLVKIDYHINDHHTLNGTFFYGRDNEVAADQAYLKAQWLSTQTQKPITGGGNWTWTPNSRWANEARFGYVYDNKVNNAVDNAVPATTYGINTGVTDPQRGGMPQINIIGFTPLGGGVNWPKFQGPDGVYQAIDNVSYVRGKHVFKFGGEVRYASVNEGSLRGNKGQVIFSPGGGGNAFPGSTPLEDFLAGAPQFGRISFGPALRHETQWSYAGFFQDDWRVTPNLTLNLGLRYEYVTPMKEDHNLLGNFDPSKGLVQVGQQIKSPYNGDHNNFGPRFGLAWDVGGKGRTLVRAGGGIIYDTLSMEAFLVQENTQNATAIGLATIPTGATIITCPANTCGVTGVVVTTPGTGTITVTSVQFNGGPLSTSSNSQITSGWQNNSPKVPLFPQTPPTCGDGVTPPGTAVPDPPPCNVLGIDRNFRTPYIATWTLGVQRAFTNNLSLNVAYVGNHASKLMGIRDLNQPVPGTTPVPGTFSAQFPYLGAINFMSNLYRANYNGLQVTMTQRVSHGLSFTAGYTYSHGLDDSSTNQNQFLPQDSRHPEREYASSDYDMRHRFTFSLSYAIPGREFPGQLLKGWQLNSIVTFQSGQPWTVNDTGNNISGTSENTDRWDFVGNRSDFTSSQMPIPFIDPSTFVVDVNNHVIGGTVAADAACIAAATSQAEKDQLATIGCYAKGHSVMIPPAAGTFGTMGRNLFRDSGFRNWDLSVTKDWKFRERLTAQFRGELFNVLNHPNFANPYGGTSGYGPGNFDDPSQTAIFGCGCATPDVAGGNPVVGSGSNRAIQLGLKLIF